MKSCSTNRFLQILWCLVILAVMISGCKNELVIHLPPAETPILETILDIDNNVIVPFNASGVFEMAPGKQYEIRLRAPWPSDITVSIGNPLPLVSDSASHPELDSSGYFRISEVRVIHPSDPRYFWRVFVVLPLAKRSRVDFDLSVYNISKDTNLHGSAKVAALEISISRTKYFPLKPSATFFDGPDAKHVKITTVSDDSAFIADNVTVAGWLTETPGRSLVDPATEDWHYYIYPDNDFIERNYSATTKPLANAIMPGRWFTWADNIFHPKIQIPLTGGNQPNASTFLLPGSDGHLGVELNAWHKSRHNMVPSGWVADPDPGTFPDTFWRFDVMKPVNILQPLGIPTNEPDLQEGDYVIIVGALVEDSAHIHFDPTEATQDDWSHNCWQERYRGHGGWLEIHPLDAIRRVISPAVRKHSRVVQVCYGDPFKTPSQTDEYLTPVPSDPPSDYSMLRYREIIDNRFTNPKVTPLVEINPHQPVKLHVKVDTQGTFKAVYLLWWEEGSTPRPTPVPQGQLHAEILNFTLPPTLQFVPNSRTVTPRTATVTVKNTGTTAWNWADVHVTIGHVSGLGRNSLTFSRSEKQDVASGATATFHLFFGCSGEETCSATVQMEINGVLFGNSMKKNAECQRFDSH